MRKIYCITYPKSGQHLLFETLLKYFSKNINFDGEVRRKNGGQIIKAGEFVFCEQGLHCYRTPCLALETTFQVMHDCNRLCKDNPQANYLFMYRNPIYCMLSLCGYGMPSYDPKIINWKEIDYWNFFLKKIKEWKLWVGKWIIGNTCKNTFYLTYEGLIANPEKEFTRIIKYIESDKEIDIEYLKKVIDFMKIEPRHKLSDFKYYKNFKSDLQNMELNIEQTLEQLKIPKIRWE